MTMTFYLGPYYKDIREKFEEIKKHYAKRLGERYSNSDCFRLIVNVLYEEIMRVKNK